jgi:hypothetical protein
VLHFPFVNKLLKLATRELERDALREHAPFQGTGAAAGVPHPGRVANGNHSHGSFRLTGEEIRQLL